MAVVSMSKQEFSRLDVLLRVQSGHLRVGDACALIGLQRRQVFRLLRGLKQDGTRSLLSKHRAKPSNHRIPAEVRTLALSIVRERYADFGPTLAAEKLAEHHGCPVSRETLRGWMIADGLWQDRVEAGWAGVSKSMSKECRSARTSTGERKVARCRNLGGLCSRLLPQG